VFLDIEEIRDKDNATGLKEGEGIEMSIYRCFPYTRLHALSSLIKYLPILFNNNSLIGVVLVLGFELGDSTHVSVNKLECWVSKVCRVDWYCLAFARFTSRSVAIISSRSAACFVL